MEDSNPPISPSVNIKEEPIDEGYDAALLPQSSIRQIKEELEHQEVGIETRQRLPHCIWIEAANRLNCFITIHRLIISVIKFNNIPPSPLRISRLLLHNNMSNFIFTLR